MVRVDPSVFRDISTNQALIPSDESLADEISRLQLKVIRLKASSWLGSIVCTPKIEDWHRAQTAILYSEDNPIDTLLSGALDFLDVNDLASVNLVITEASQIHLEVVEKQHLFEQQANLSKIYKTTEVIVHGDADKAPVALQQRTFQTVSATNIQERTNNLYVQMSNALTGNAFRGTKMTDSQDHVRPRHPKNSIFNLPLHLV